MLIQEFKRYFFLMLSNAYPETEIQSFFTILVEYKLHLSRIQLALEHNFELDNDDLDFLQNALLKLKNQIPIQYIVGETTFYGLMFEVDKNVLIPRPETEELVEWIVKNHKNRNSLKILDVGTGSGCIAISLAKNLPNAKVSALDISAEALTIAKNNAILNNVTIDFINADILTISKLPDTFDIIVSNPPYVRELEKAQMQQNVLSNEPHIALFVKDENPLLFYDKIAELAKNYLTKNGVLYFEINQYLGRETVDLLKSKGFKNIEVKKDIYGVDRMVKCLKF
ncbi:MAG: peptide chain release factor N(5)-glutamine methyltransferase [Bacteroidetes bacterium HGW-Bacteroidetes-3]|jgi:release factor glutamine methyltransferase|nr:MAG: peptide chain release factor N(5)-glutamine methyltransferase [Bacteroidetes bacterium HGW-Bacteroidetes-3]